MFNLQVAMFLDATTVTAAVETTDWSFATAAAGPVPEPETSALLLGGFGLLAALSRRRPGRSASA